MKIADDKQTVALIDNQVDIMVGSFPNFEEYARVSNFSKLSGKYFSGHCPLWRQYEDEHLEIFKKCGNECNALGMSASFGKNWKEQIQKICDDRWNMYLVAHRII